MASAAVPAFDDDLWELYDGSVDWSQANDLSSEMPDKLHQLQRLWLIEAVRHGVLPIDDRGAERLNPEIAGRPQLIRGSSQLLFAGMKRLSENSVISIKNKSFSVTAHVVAPEAPLEGVVVAQGGAFGGWALYAKQGKAKFVYNVLGLREFVTESEQVVPSGEHQVRVEFAYDGGGLGKGGDVALFLDGKEIGTGRVEVTQPLVFSADETTDVGKDAGMPVTPDYEGADRFNGTIELVQIDVGDDDHDHLIDPDALVRVAMARQ
jgi:arylsulfatase